MRSDRLYFAIALVALLVMLAGSAYLSPPGNEVGNRAAVFIPTQPIATPPVTSGAPISLEASALPTQTMSSSAPASTEAPPEAPTEAPTVVMLEAVVTPEQAAPTQFAAEPVPPPTSQPPTPAPVVQPQVISATAIPIPPSAPESEGGPVPVPNNHPGPRWVTLQAGHLRNQNLPDELRHLVPNTGAFSSGVSEVDVNEEVAQKTAQRLIERGYKVDLLDATVPIDYTTDLFIAIHSDGNIYSSVRGFKAVAPWNSVPESDDFVGYLYEEYGKSTRLPSDARTSVAMANYYAFNPWRYRHAVSAGVPSALLEMGFVTNPDDRKVLTMGQDSIAWGIANAVDRYFRSGKAGPIPTAYPSFTPTTTPTSLPTSTPTVTSTYTATPTETPLPTDTPTAVPTELMVGATQTALFTTSALPTVTPTLRRPTATTVTVFTKTPIPTPTPLQGIITDDGRWLPQLSATGRNLPRPGSSAPPVLMSSDIENIRLRAIGRELEQVWEQFYIPELGRSVWRKATLRQVRH